MADPIWQDNVTPLNAANMTKLQTRDEKGGLNGYASLDGAGSLTNLGLALYAYVLKAGAGGDPQPRFTIQNSGHLYWGSGAANPDTNLYRGAAGSLDTDSSFQAQGTISGPTFSSYQPGGVGTALEAAVGGDAQYRFIVASDGRMNWGTGAAASDTNLYRGNVGELHTDGSFYAGKGVAANLNLASQIWMSPDGRLYFSAASDTSLYRADVNSLQTDGYFTAGLGAWGYVPFLNNVALGASLSTDNWDRFHVFGSGNIEFGPGNVALDTNLYRSAAGVLKTDGSFAALKGLVLGDAANVGALNALFGDVTNRGMVRVGISGDTQPRGVIAADGSYSFGPGGTTAVDTSLTRQSAGVLAINGVPIGGGVKAAVTRAAGSPAYVSSTSPLMLGLNTQITPSATGKVAFWITGRIPAPAFDTYTWTLRYGVGTPPANGAAATGTAIGQPVSFTTNINYALTLMAHVIGLTVGTPYWFDVSVSSAGPNPVTLQDVTMMALEVG